MRTRRSNPAKPKKKPLCAVCGDVGLDLASVYVMRVLGQRRRSEWGTRAVFDRKPAMVLCLSCYSRTALRTRPPRCRQAARSRVGVGVGAHPCQG